MLVRPALAPHLHVATIGDQGIFVGSDLGATFLSGAVFGHIVRHIHQDVNIDQLCDVVARFVGHAEAYYAVQLLEQKGILIERMPRILPEGLAEHFLLQGVTIEAVLKNLDDVTISIHSIGVDTDAISVAIKALGVKVCEDGTPVLFCDSYLNPKIEEFNQNALDQSKRWLLAKPNGQLLQVGPFFDSRKSPCWICLATRMRRHLVVEDFVRIHSPDCAPFPSLVSVLPATQRIATEWVALEVLKCLVLADSPEACKTMQSFHIGSWKGSQHVVTRRPQCPACGNPSHFAASSPTALEMTSKKAGDGGHRTKSPEETLQAIHSHIDPLTGVVGSLTSLVTSEAAPLYVYRAGYNFAIPDADFSMFRRGLRNRCGGKGTTDAAARASAACEAIERSSGLFEGYESRISSTFRRLGNDAIHPNAVMLFSDDQYRERELINDRNRKFGFVPLPFDEDAELEWTQVWSLTGQQVRFLPTQLCYYGYPISDDKYFCPPDSNGCASGNTKEEAIVQGFLELVERDAVAIWWYNRLSRPRVDFSTFEEPYFYRVARFLEGHGRNLWVLDLTTDIGIPVFVALSRRLQETGQDIIFGFGAHLNPRIAISRAITELNQFLPFVLNDKAIQRAREELEDQEVLDWFDSATVENQAFLDGNKGLPSRLLNDFMDLSADNVGADCIVCEGLVEKLGMHLYVLDQTRPDVGLPVVRVIVPGLRHFWARFAPGRLYTVPVKLGWLQNATLEHRLNPIDMFL